MTFEAQVFLFKLMTFAPGPLWIALLFKPTHRYTRLAIDTFLVFACIIYATIILPNVLEVIPVLASPQLIDIRNLLASPAGALASWVHFIIGDLWIGRWIALDSVKLELPTFVRVPILLLTLLLGPLGLITYLTVRSIKTKESPFHFSESSRE
jgi:hypothetical protein